MSKTGVSPLSNQISSTLKKVAPDNIINSVYDHTAKNIHVAYDSAKRVGKSSIGRWDCSEMSAHTIQSMIKVMKDSDVEFKTNFDKLSKAFPTYSTTASQRAALDNLPNTPKVTGKANVMKDLEVGMLIYMTYPKTKSGYSGHVATVSRDPSTGRVMISESNGAAGVTQRTVESFFNSGKAAAPSTKFIRYDPFSQDRPVLRAMEKEADNFVTAYKEAEKRYQAEANSPYRKVGAKMPSKANFIQDFLEENFPKSDYKGNTSSRIEPHNNKYDSQKLPSTIRAASNEQDDSNIFQKLANSLSGATQKVALFNSTPNVDYTALQKQVEDNKQDNLQNNTIKHKSTLLNI